MKSCINISLLLHPKSESSLTSLLCLTDGWESASMSEDDDDSEWVNVHHSSDEDQTEVVRILSLDLMLDLIVMMHI